jgi:GNAT superfamily N-acetyltransferase
VAHVRLAHAADTALVTELLVEFRDWWSREDPSEGAVVRGVARLLADTESDVLLAGVDGFAVLRYRFVVWVDGEECELEDLYVREAARKTGVGRALTEAAIERALARGCGRMMINANEANRPALALYESLGFSAWFDPPGGNNLNLRRPL